MVSNEMVKNTLTDKEISRISKQKNIRILIVENNPVDAAVAEKLLELLHYQNIVVTNSGGKAIKMFSDARFDLVILGTDLPDLNEIDVCHQLRVMCPDFHLPILVYTTFGKEPKPEMLNTIFDDFLFKIMGIEDFARVIERCAPYKVK